MWEAGGGGQGDTQQCPAPPTVHTARAALQTGLIPQDPSLLKTRQLSDTEALDESPDSKPPAGDWRPQEEEELAVCEAHSPVQLGSLWGHLSTPKEPLGASREAGFRWDYSEGSGTPGKIHQSHSWKLQSEVWGTLSEGDTELEFAQELRVTAVPNHF